MWLNISNFLRETTILLFYAVVGLKFDYWGRDFVSESGKGCSVGTMKELSNGDVVNVLLIKNVSSILIKTVKII